MKKNPAFISYKIVRNIGYGLILLGIFSFVGKTLIIYVGFSFTVFSMFLVFVLSMAFIALVVLKAIYMLGEVTRNLKIKNGLRLFGFGLLTIFFIVPLLSIIGFISSVLVLLVSTLAIIISLIGWILVLLGLIDYGRIEGSKGVVRYSFLATILAIVYPLFLIFFFAVRYSIPALLVTILYLLLDLLVSILLGYEFLKIRDTIRRSIVVLDLNTLKKEIEDVPFEALFEISKSRNIPFILLASLKSR